MKRIILVLFAMVALTSCFKDRYEASGTNGEKEVEIQIYGVSEQQTKGTIQDENIVRTLDLLVFKNGRFLYWRSAYQVDGHYRATLNVDNGIDVYFLANSRDHLFGIFPNESAEVNYIGSSWDSMMDELVDNNPQRLVQDSYEYKPLPMWGTMKNLSVQDVPMNRWPSVTLMRSVASVDVMVRDTVTTFQLTDLYVYYAPDKGYLGTHDYNYSGDGYVYSPVSPYNMRTAKTLHSSRYEPYTMSIANQIYMYDNPYKQNTYNPDERNSRVVVGGYFQGEMRYYPIDFEDTDKGEMVAITRNWKYIFMINSVFGRGYPTPEIAANEPPIDINFGVYEWRENVFGDIGVSWPYYVWLEKSQIYLMRDAGNYIYVGMSSNVPEDQIRMEFMTMHNGMPREVREWEPDCEGNGITNDRFRIEKVRDYYGPDMMKLKFTALGDYDSGAPWRNEDEIRITAGQITFLIKINQLDRSNTDWLDGGEEEVQFN